VIPKDPIGDGFAGEIRLWSLGGLAMTSTMAPSIQILRTGGHLRRDPVDHWFISYCARGAHLARTADTELEVPARTPYLWSLGQEFLHERTHVDRVQLLMVRDVFRDISHLIDAACGSLLNTPLGHLLGDYMMALERRLPALTEADFPLITNAVGAMVAAGVAPSAGRVAVAKPQIDLGRRERVRQAIRKHLRTPTLGPKSLGRLVGMSRSSLYRLFEDTGGVACYIQRERLLEARAVLSDPEKTQSISEIAEDLCFADASSFSGTFKREFGCTPTDARYAALSAPELGATSKTRVQSARAHFSDLLHGLWHRRRRFARRHPKARKLGRARYSRGTPGSSRTLGVVVDSYLISASNGGRSWSRLQ